MRGSTTLRRVRISIGSVPNMSSWLIRASGVGACPGSIRIAASTSPGVNGRPCSSRL